MPEMQGVLAKLTTPEQAATLIHMATPTLTVFSHIVKKELPGAAGDTAVLARVRKAGASGRITMGHDRETIDVGDSMKLLRPPSLAALPDLDSKSAAF